MDDSLLFCIKKRDPWVALVWLPMFNAYILG
jgi:hypothetical protein